MDQHRLPKLKPIELSRYVMDLLMVQEGNDSSVSEPRVRIIWHLLFFSIVFFSVGSVFTLSVLRSLFPANILVATVWRAFLICFFVYCLSLLAILTVRHYLFLLRTGKDLKFGNILFFYFACVIMFARLYEGLFFLKASFFDVPAPVFSPAPYLMDAGIKAHILFGDFLVYSASVIVSLDYPRIHSASVVVSICNVMELLFGIGFITILVGTFLQKADIHRPKRLSN